MVFGRTILYGGPRLASFGMIALALGLKLLSQAIRYNYGLFAIFDFD